MLQLCASVEINTSKIEITSLPISDPSALANSPLDHFSRRRRYHQCPDWDQTFSKGSFTSLLKLSNKSTFNVRARRTKLSFYCRIQGILWFLLFFHTFFTNFFEIVFLKLYFSEVFVLISHQSTLYTLWPHRMKTNISHLHIMMISSINHTYKGPVKTSVLVSPFNGPIVELTDQ